MPMERENHENLLNELLNTELEHSRRTEILQELRADYGTVLTDFNQLNESNQKLQTDNDDLIVSNSKLFRQAGIIGNKDKEEEHEKATFSESITIESLEK